MQTEPHSRRRVVVTGMGCISPLGNDPTQLWSNLIAGKSGVGAITYFDTSRSAVKIAAEVRDFNAAERFGSREARRMDRFAQLGLAAAIQAVENSRLSLSTENRDRIGVLIGSGIGGVTTLFEQFCVYHQRGPERVSPFLVPMMIPDSVGGLVAITFGLRGPNLAVSAACATGNYAIGEATEIIRRGQADVMLAGGAEGVLHPIAVAGLHNMTALSTRNDEPQRASRPFDRQRDGFVMGEGSAVLVLEALEHAQARQANILAEISGYGASNDAFHITAPDEHGAGAALCMKLALADAHLAAADIGYINAHGTSTPLNDKSETVAIKAVFGEQAYRVPISSTKSMTGHLLGAAGALEALICVQVLQHGLLPPTINYEFPDPDCDLDYVPNTARLATVRHAMSNSFGFGGHNATLIVSRFEEV